MMDVKQQWERYAACWSMSAPERDAALPLVVDESVVYRDPATELSGRAQLGEYMESFRTAAPGSRFVIDEVAFHHGRSLARWHQQGDDDEVVARGTSFARHDAAWLLVDVTGFFGT
jgi:hypothetical protein